MRTTVPSTSNARTGPRSASPGVASRSPCCTVATAPPGPARQPAPARRTCHAAAPGGQRRPAPEPWVVRPGHRVRKTLPRTSVERRSARASVCRGLIERLRSRREVALLLLHEVQPEHRVQAVEARDGVGDLVGADYAALLGEVEVGVQAAGE